jgi:hypothetical protein
MASGQKYWDKSKKRSKRLCFDKMQNFFPFMDSVQTHLKKVEEILERMEENFSFSSHSL